jgi:hypothetical protein
MMYAAGPMRYARDFAEAERKIGQEQQQDYPEPDSKKSWNFETHADRLQRLSTH